MTDITIHSDLRIFPVTKQVREDPWLREWMELFICDTGDWYTCMKHQEKGK